MHLLLALVLSGLALVFYPFLEVFGRPRIVRHVFTPQNWTPGLHLRIAVISDIHACDPWMTPARIEDICKQVQALDADVILLLGDYVKAVGQHAQSIPDNAWAQILGSLAAPLGVHAILGNHDYGQDERFQLGQIDRPAACSALIEAGIAVYRNKAIRLEKHGHAFWLAGLDDQMALLPGPRYARTTLAGLDDLDATLDQVTDQAPILLMAHEPDVFDTVPARVSLTLSGHTHGGQISWLAPMGRVQRIAPLSCRPL